MEDLKPCPFCGGPARLWDQAKGKAVVGCAAGSHCCAVTPHIFGTEAEAITAWNTRPSPARDEGAGTMEDREEWRSQILIAVLDAMRSWRGHTPERVAIEIAEAIIALAAPVSAPGMGREEEGVERPEPAREGRGDDPCPAQPANTSDTGKEG